MLSSSTQNLFVRLLQLFYCVYLLVRMNKISIFIDLLNQRILYFCTFQHFIRDNWKYLGRKNKNENHYNNFYIIEGVEILKIFYKSLSLFFDYTEMHYFVSHPINVNWRSQNPLTKYSNLIFKSSRFFTNL